MILDIIKEVENMNEELLKQKIREVIKSREYQKLKTILSLEERIYLIENDFFELEELDVLSQVEIITMCLTEKEAEDLLPKLGENELLDIFILANLEEIEKENLINNNHPALEDENNKKNLIMFSNNDELKIKYLKEIQDEFDKTEIIRNLKNDELKIKYLEEIENEFYKAEIIKSLKIDTLKLKSLISLNSEFLIGDVIISFQSDDLKLRGLKLLNNEMAKPAIIKSLKSDELKFELLMELTDEEKKAEILESFSDESRIKCLKKTDDEIIKYNLIKGLSTDELKIKYINEISLGFLKCLTIKEFKSEKLKIKALKQLTKEHEKAEVISILSSDELKIEWLNTLTKDQAKGVVIRSLKDDELKVKCLPKLTSELEKTTVIATLKNDKLKLIMLDLINDEHNKIDIIKSLRKDELKIQELNKISNEQYKVEIIFMLKNDKLLLKSLSTITSMDNIKMIINHKEMHEEVPVPIEIIIKYSEFYKVDIVRLNILIQKFGYKILRVLNVDEIKKVFLLTDEEFQKYLSIFSEKNINIGINESSYILETIFNKKFKKDVSEIDRIFPNLELLIEQHQYDKIKQILIDIDKTVPLKKYIKEELDKFILELNKDKNKDILHKITNEYIEIKKSEYVNLEMKNILYDINIEKNFRYDKGFITKKVIATTSIEDLLKLIKSIPTHLLGKQELELANNNELLTEIIKFKKSPNQYGDNSIIKPYLKSFEKLFTVLYEEDKLKDKTYDIYAKRTLMPKKVSKEFLISIMAEIDIEKLKDKIFSDDLIYQQLLTILNTYKLLGIGSTYDGLFEKINTPCNNVTIASLISSLSVINKKLEEDIVKKKITGKNLYNYIVYANTYGSMSELYTKLFGKENYDLISTDKGPNTSGQGAKKRLPKAVEYIKDMYKREYVSIPTMDRTIKLEDKVMNIVVGNVTNMMNLTYGERTGACMRIYGAGDTLFDFCLKDENGFHIRFTDPDTQEFVSRVSGFRNGNTVFLNQLRHSVSEKYSDEDVVKFCKEVARILIQNSKNSKYPIENVVISPEYAMEEHKSEIQRLDVPYIKEGMGTFYSDINSENAILLASNSKDEKLVPIELGPDKKERYTPQRDKVQLVEKEEEIIEKIARIQMIDQLLEDISLENCLYNIPNNLEKCYVGEDWYVTVDKFGNIDMQIMKNSVHKDKALEEINILKEILGVDLKEQLEEVYETQKRI